MKNGTCFVALMLFTCFPVDADDVSYQTDFEAEEFEARRAAVYVAIGDNIAVIQGAEDVNGFFVFRQSNTYYYLSGLEAASAYMLLDGKKKQTTIYLPHRDAERERGEGRRLAVEDADLVKKITGVADVRPLEKLGKDLAGRYAL